MAILCLILSTLLCILPTTASTDLSPLGIDGQKKDWVLLIKLGNGGNNCKQRQGEQQGKNQNQNQNQNYQGEDYECGQLYADSTNQTLRHIPNTVHDPNGPLYKSWSQGALDPSVAYQVWNDQSGKANVPPLGPGISAHDKGFLLFNNESGLLCTHTCPHWLYSASGRFRSPSTFYNTTRPGGDASSYSQSFLLIALQNLTHVNAVRKMIARENAHLFYSNVGTTNIDLFPKYPEVNQPVSTTVPTVPMHALFNSTLILFTKHRNEHYDYWAYFTETFCGPKAPESLVWTYVKCPSTGILTSSIVTDYNCYTRNNRYGQGSTFGVSNWYPNHMKVGYCLKENVVAIAGWNHKKTQLLRGSMFAVIRSTELHDSFHQLFPYNASTTQGGHKTPKALEALEAPKAPMSTALPTQYTASWPTRDSVPINQFPFVMTHDAGTGYMNGGVVSWWAKTQSTGLGGQANCGARAFDIRPLVIGNGHPITFHHADIAVDKALVDAVQELITFANENPNELLLLYISHCQGANCQAATQAALANIGVPSCTDGGQLHGATYGSVKTMGRMSGGGAMLAIYGFVAENYDASLTCYGDWGDCYAGGGKEEEGAFDPLWNYMRQVSAEAPASSGAFQMVQAHWQYDAESIATGVLHASSILTDETRSAVNSQVADAVTCSPCPGPSGLGVFKYANIIEVNNVCDGGGKLYDALRTRVP